MECNWISPVCNTSYGLTASYLISELMSLGVNLHIHPLGPIYLEDKFIEKFGYLFSSPYNWRFFPKAPCVRLYHQFDLNMWIGSGPRIGFPIFELDGFTEREKLNLSHPDILIVCSHWARNVVSKHVSRDNIFVVPLGVDNKIFKPSLMPDFPNTIFLNIGKFEIRKGHDVLLRAFCKAFNKDDNVSLILLPKNPFLSPLQEKEWVNYYKNSPLGEKILIYDRVNSHSDLSKIISNSHVGVFPSRAEGWNLPILEMMSMGKHIIATNVTAHTEYLNSTNSKLVNLNKITTAYDGVFFNGQGEWHDWDDSAMDELIHYMREFHNLRKTGALQVNNEGIKTANMFTWSNSAAKLKLILENCGV